MPKQKKKIKVRGSWFGVNPITRMTPTLVDKQRKTEKKYRKSWKEGYE